jgi:DNA mismatch repair ATPase MutS
VGVEVTISRPSILFDNADDGVATCRREQPSCFVDLNLDQVVAATIRGREEHDLTPFFHTPLHDVDAVRYRQEVLRDLEVSEVRHAIESFARAMRAVRRQRAIAAKMRYRYQRASLLLEAVDAYGVAVIALTRDLAALDVTSPGLLKLRRFLAAHTASSDFTAVLAEARALQTSLAGIRYCLHIHGNRVQVTAYDGEEDDTEAVLRIFEKFKREDSKDYRIKFSDRLDMNHVEAQILDLVAVLNPIIFANLDAFSARYSDFLDPTVVAFDREVQFYLAYLEFIDRFKAAGLAFAYPSVSTTSKEICAKDAFDLALAGTLVSESAGTGIVRNDFSLVGPERVLVVTGPNQGGKTTFARMFGQLHYLGSLGFPVPAASARLFLPDALVTHFEKEEDLATGQGKLEEELTRMHAALATAGASSLFILNESFTSTTLADALFLGTAVLTQIIALDALCVGVTFVDELASLSPTTVSMVSTVDPDDPATRTFKIVRRPADGLAYAAAIAEKYGLGYTSLKARLQR